MKKWLALLTVVVLLTTVVGTAFAQDPAFDWKPYLDRAGIQ